MAFKTDKFMSDKFEPRRKVVPVPALAAWFDEGDEPEWEVRGLNSNELNIALEAKAKRESVDNIIKALAETGDQAKAVREAIGIVQATTPGEVIKRLEMLTFGSVRPKIEMPTAVKLAETFPIEFLQLTHEISTLTGMGFDLVKPQAASQTTPA